MAVGRDRWRRLYCWMVVSLMRFTGELESMSIANASEVMDGVTMDAFQTRWGEEKESVMYSEFHVSS